MKIIWKAVELANWKTASFDSSVVFSCIFSVVAACVLPPTYWGYLGDTLRGARAGHSPFGSIWFSLDCLENWWGRCFKWELSVFGLISVSIYMYIINHNHISYHFMSLYYASYILFLYFYSIQLAFCSVIAFPHEYYMTLDQATPSP